MASGERVGSSARRPFFFAAGALLSIGVLTALFVLATGRIPVNSDQAIVGLMAKHILEGKGHPVFYYGSAYAGSLEAHYVAGVFAVLGASPGAYRFAMTLLFLATSVGVFTVTRSAFGGHAALAAIGYLAVPPFFFLYKGLTSDGWYNTFNLLTLAIVWLALQIEARERKAVREVPLHLLLGLAMGLAFWVGPLAPVVLIALLAWLLLRRESRPTLRGWLAMAGGFLTGAFPWWFWNLRHCWASLNAPELGLVSLRRALGQLGGLLWTALPTLAGGVRPTPNILFSGEIFPGARLLALLFLAALLGYSCWRAARRDRPRLLFLLVLFALLAAAAFSGRLVVSEPRFLFLYYVLVPPLIGAALAECRKRRGFAVTAFVLASLALLLNVTSVLAAGKNRTIAEGEVTGSLGPLMRALERQRSREVYTDYWTAYRLSFESGERIIATPIAGEDLVRYRPYWDEVGASPMPAVVLLGSRDRCFRRFLDGRKAAYRRLEAGPYGVYTALPPEALDTVRRGLGLPLPSEAYRVSWRFVAQPRELRAGSSMRVGATVRNEGPCVWTSLVHGSYHWWPLDPGRPGVWDGERGMLPGLVKPGETAALEIPLLAPRAPGRYRLEYDLVHEGVNWFSTRGGKTVSVELEVTASEAR